MNQTEIGHNNSGRVFCCCVGFLILTQVFWSLKEIDICKRFSEWIKENNQSLKMVSSNLSILAAKQVKNGQD